MKALCWHGKHDVRIEKVPDPRIINDRDIIIKITTSAICGSDLHLYNDLMPMMHAGDILGHEFMGEVVEVGQNVANLKIGDRVVVPFTISCGRCYFCKNKLYSLCECSNPNVELARKQMGQSPAGLFGYTHLLGGFPGGQAEYVRVPYGDIGPLKIPEGMKDESVLFLSDIFPTGYMAAEFCNIRKGETVAIWGCGPVAQFAILSAWLLGAGRVIAIDSIPERLQMAENVGGAETINFLEEDVYDSLMVMTQGQGPDACIDAVGTEAHIGPALDAIVDRVKQSLHLTTDRPHALREAIQCCRKGGTISVPGVYINTLDNLPFGAAMNKGLTFKMGQTPVQAYLKPLLKIIEDGKIDPTQVITHRINLDEVPETYKLFNNRKEGCVKAIIKP